MEDGKQHSIRLTVEDLAVIREIQGRTGLTGTSAAIRFALRQYAIANKIEFRPSSKKKTK